MCQLDRKGEVWLRMIFLLPATTMRTHSARSLSRSLTRSMRAVWEALLGLLVLLGFVGVLLVLLVPLVLLALPALLLALLAQLVLPGSLVQRVRQALRGQQV